LTFNGLHGVAFQKIELFVFTAVREKIVSIRQYLRLYEHLKVIEVILERAGKTYSCMRHCKPKEIQLIEEGF
jgi:hypothetical protein